MEDDDDGLMEREDQRGEEKIKKVETGETKREGEEERDWDNEGE